MCFDKEEWCQIWRGNDLSFQNWHEEFDEFWPEHSKVSKICPLMGFFYSKWKMYELKIYRGVMCYDIEEWSKNSKRNCLSFQKWHEVFDEIWPKHLKASIISTLMGSFWSKYITLELKKYRGVMFVDTEDWCKIWRKTDLCFQKWHEEFGKFSQAEKKAISF